MHNIYTEVNSPSHKKHELSKHPSPPQVGSVGIFIKDFIKEKQKAELDSHSQLSVLQTALTIPIFV